MLSKKAEMSLRLKFQTEIEQLQRDKQVTENNWETASNQLAHANEAVRRTLSGLENAGLIGYANDLRSKITSFGWRI